MKTLIAATLLIGLGSVPAFADWYIVQDTSSKNCTITEQKPTETTKMVVSGNTVYKSRLEAEGAIKMVKVCENGTVGAAPAPGTAPSH